MKIVKLSEICTFSRGLTYSKSDEVDFSSNVVLRANNIDLDSNSLNLEDLRYIKDSIKIKEEKIAKKNSLIICTASGSKTHVGKVALIDEDYGYAFGGFMGQLTPTDNCHHKFLYYVLTSGLFKDFLMSLNDGTNINNLKFSDIENYEVPLPTLEKQREIVEKLDSAYTEIALLEENLINRAELIELLLQGALSVPYKSAISNSANSMRLGEIADFQGGSQPAKSNFLYKEQKGYIRFIQIRDFGSDKNLTYIPIASKNRLCAKSDILIGRYGASVGKILTGLDGAYNVALMKVIPKNEIVDRDYLYFYLLSEIFQTNLLNVSDRSAQNGFSKDDISSFPVIIPSLREQQEIVAKLSKVRNNILELNLVQLKTKAELSLLRKSLLSNALTQEEAVA